jgi:hypothetical protein
VAWETWENITQGTRKKEREKTSSRARRKMAAAVFVPVLLLRTRALSRRKEKKIQS